MLYFLFRGMIFISKNITKDTESTFESIKHIDEEGREYWLARELQQVLEYKKWERFSNVINNAKTACKKSNKKIEDYFPEVGKIVRTGVATKTITDYKLSRYACYLIAMNGDSRKEVIALAQTYFAVKTRLQELSEKEYSELTEDEKRMYQREQTKKGNRSLNKTARNSGVKNFDKFHNAGYKGLYNGETADDIAKRKGLRYREDILDNMGSEELVDNLFRIVQTDSKLKKDNIKSEKEANQVHYNMGKDIREFIRKQGGTLPENLELPNKSLKEIGKRNKVIKQE